MHEDTPL